jgi:hypothetical protein
MNHSIVSKRKAWAIVFVLFLVGLSLGSSGPALMNMASQVSGILGLANGGTGQSSLTVAAHYWFGNNSGSIATPVYGQPACGDLSNSAAGCQMSTTAGGDLSGTLPSPNVVSAHISGGTNTDLVTFNSTGNLVNWAGSSTCTGTQAIQSMTAAGTATCITTISGTLVDAETPTGTCPTTTLTLASAPNPATSLKLYKNGQREIVGASGDYTLSSSTITLASSCASGDQYIAEYRH